MKYIRLLIELLWRGWFYLHASAVITLFYPVYFVLLQRQSWFIYVFRLYQLCARILLFNAGIRPVVIRRYQPDRKQAYVICSNHGSYLDIVTTYIAMPHYFHFMGKAELKNLPLFGYFFKEMNIPVDRGSIISAHKAYQRAASDLEKGISVALFPEGGISFMAPRLKSFKNGAFRLAIEKQVPVLPILFPDNYKIMPDGILRRMRAGRPGKTRLIVLPPVSTEGMNKDDTESLKYKVFNLMQQELERCELVRI